MVFDSGLTPSSPEWSYCQDLLTTLAILPQEAPSFETTPWYTSLDNETLQQIVKQELTLSPKNRIDRCQRAFELIEEHLSALEKSEYSTLLHPSYRASQLQRLTSLLNAASKRLNTIYKIHANVLSPYSDTLGALAIKARELASKTRATAQSLTSMSKKQNLLETSSLTPEQWQKLIKRFRTWAGVGFRIRRQLAQETYPNTKQLKIHLEFRWEKLFNFYCETSRKLVHENQQLPEIYPDLLNMVRQEKIELVKLLS